MELPGHPRRCVEAPFDFPRALFDCITAPFDYPHASFDYTHAQFSNILGVGSISYNVKPFDWPCFLQLLSSLHSIDVLSVYLLCFIAFSFA